MEIEKQKKVNFLLRVAVVMFQRLITGVFWVYHDHLW